MPGEGGDNLPCRYPADLPALLINDANPFVGGKQRQHVLATGQQRDGRLAGCKIAGLHHGADVDGTSLVNVANELFDVVVGRTQDDVLGTPLLLDGAIAQDGDAVAEPQRLVEIVGDEDDGLLQRFLQA